MTRFDAMVRPDGAKHPLAGLPQATLDAAERGARQMSDVDPSDPVDIGFFIESILTELRAGGHLIAAPRFVAVPEEHEVGQTPGWQVLDIGDGLASQVYVTEMLFGSKTIEERKARWAVENLNTNMAVTPEAWARHEGKIREGAR